VTVALGSVDMRLRPRLLLPLLVFLPAALAGACGDDTSVAPTADAATIDAPRSDGGAGADVVLAPVGSGSVTGVDAFGVVTTKWADAGPFSNKQRLLLTLSDDFACGRSGCGDYHELYLRFSGPSDGGQVGPGTYAVLLAPDAGLAGSVEPRLRYETRSGNGCTTGEQPAARGTATIDTVTASQLKGTFDVDINESDGGVGHLTGTFDAVNCP
jgi:hypothetical protein